MMIDVIELFVVITISINLTFIQGHRDARQRNV